MISFLVCLFLFPKFAKTLQKVYTNVKNTNNRSNCRKNSYKVQCRTAPRGQGQIQHGISTGTVSSTGFWLIIVLEFGSKSCLRVLQNFMSLPNILKFATNALKSANGQGAVALPPQPRAVPLWVYYGNSTGIIFFWKLLEFGTKSCLKMGQKIKMGTEISRSCSNCMKKICPGRSAMGIPLEQCSGQGLGNCHVDLQFGILIR